MTIAEPVIRWARPGVPHRGWAIVGVEDLGECEATCEMCGKEQIRYLHQVAHVEHEDLFVGCVCAEKMTGDYVTPRKMEASLRKLSARRARWLVRRWRLSSKGNPYLNVQGLNVGILPDSFHPGSWKWRMGGSFSTRRYSTPNEAKLALLDELIARRTRRLTRSGVPS